MQQALHIFIKDVRRLRYDLTVVLALTVTFAWCEGHRIPFSRSRVSQVADLLKVFLPLAWWYLAAQVVFGEPLPGDCQFWVTRPYRWKSLLSAKLLFIIAFVNLPLLLSDCFIVAHQGFHPFAHPAALAWRQVLFFVVLMLPVTALACITVSIAQMALAVLAVIAFLAVVSLWSWGGRLLWWGCLDWVRDSLAFLALSAAGLAVVVVQYRARRTLVCRIISGLAVILVLVVMTYLPWKAAFSLQSRLVRSRIDTSSVSAQFEPGGAPPAAAAQVPPGTVRVSLPIRLTGVPAQTVAYIDGIVAEFPLPDGKPAEPLWIGGPATDTPWHETFVDRKLFDRVKNAPLRMHVTILLTLFGSPQAERLPLGSELRRVPGVGVCHTEPDESQKTTRLGCLAPFRLPPGTMIQFDNGRPAEEWGSNSYSPYPAEFGISPMSSSYWQVPNQPGAAALVFTIMQPLAHIRRELDIPGLRLAEFAS